MREVFAAICDGGRAARRRASPCRGSRPTRAAWSPRGVVREPTLLVLDEVRVARWPMLFDDARARAELGYSSEPARSALARAARAAVA